MKIVHLWPTIHCFKCNKLGHYARDCHNRPYANIEPMVFDYARSPKYCHVCNQLGHLPSHCLNRSHINAVASINPDGGVGRKELYSRSGNFPNNRGNRQMRSKTYITCWNCREKGHYQKECRAPPSGQNRGNISEKLGLSFHKEADGRREDILTYNSSLAGSSDSCFIKIGKKK